MTDAIEWKIAGFGRSAEFKPVTIGDLRRTGRVLEAHCNDCGRFAELKPAPLPFTDDQPVPTAGRRMRCARCGGTSITTRPQVYETTVAEHQAKVAAEQKIEIRSRERNDPAWNER